jgi:hypothetical protein
MGDRAVKIHEKLAVIQAVGEAVASGDLAAAGVILRRRYPAETPWTPALKASGSRSPARLGGGRHLRKYTETFLRDGFVDRYTGQPLIFPGALLLLSHLLPDTFPYHKNWRSGACHSAYWDFYPTIDHIDPGGVDAPSNWFSTTQNNNAAKGNRTLKQVGWPTFPPGNIGHWDGMMNWFVDYMGSHPETLSNRKVSEWFRASLGLAEAPAPPIADAKPLSERRTPVAPRNANDHWHVHAHIGDGAGPPGHSTGREPHMHAHPHEMTPSGVGNSHYHAHCFRLSSGAAKSLTAMTAKSLIADSTAGKDWRKRLQDTETL